MAVKRINLYELISDDDNQLIYTYKNDFLLKLGNKLVNENYRYIFRIHPLYFSRFPMNEVFNLKDRSVAVKGFQISAVAEDSRAIC